MGFFHANRIDQAADDLAVGVLRGGRIAIQLGQATIERLLRRCDVVFLNLQLGGFVDDDLVSNGQVRRVVVENRADAGRDAAHGRGLHLLPASLEVPPAKGLRFRVRAVYLRRRRHFELTKVAASSPSAWSTNRWTTSSGRFGTWTPNPC